MESSCSPLLSTTDWLDERLFLLRAYFLKRGLPAPACGHGPIKKKRRDYSHMDLLCDKAGFGKPASVKLSQYLVLWAPTPLCPALVSACIKFRGNFLVCLP